MNQCFSSSFSSSSFTSFEVLSGEKEVAIGKLDLLKFFLQIGWENKLIDTKKYAVLSEDMNEVGRMLGGWKNGLETKLPPKR